MYAPGTLFKTIRSVLMRDSALATPVSDMQTRRGLLAAYWKTPGQRDGLLFAGGIAGLSVLIGANTIQMGLQYAEVAGNIAKYSDLGPDAFSVLQDSVVGAAGLTVAQTGLLVSRHLLSSNLHRKWAGWLRNQFTDAMLSTQNSAHHMRHYLVAGEHGEEEPLKSIDQRVADGSKAVAGTVIGLSMGAITTTSSFVSAARELVRFSFPVEGLEFLGSYGTLTLAFACAGTAVGASTYVAFRFGKTMARLEKRVSEAEARFRLNISNIVQNSFYIAASEGQPLEKKAHQKLFAKTDRAWYHNNYINAGYMGFSQLYNPFSKKIVAYLPGLPNYLAHGMGILTYLKLSSLTGSLINGMDWFIDVMPALSDVENHIVRLIDTAKGAHAVHDPAAFYARSGVSEFSYNTQSPELGLRIRNLELMHAGHDAQPFLKVPRVVLRPGDSAQVVGPNGAGKSCFLKAIEGKHLWPHGRGMVTHPDAMKSFYATQDIEIQEGATLKELITYNRMGIDDSDEDIQTLLDDVGLSRLKPYLHSQGKEDGTWKDLSGGEKQKLMAARILLHDPDLLFLDEADSAMDMKSRADLYNILYDRLRNRSGREDAIIIAVVHQEKAPIVFTGEAFFTHRLEIVDGVMHQKDFSVSVAKLPLHGMYPGGGAFKPLTGPSV